MKSFKFIFTRVWLLALLIWAFGLRALLVWAQWPPLNSDEGTMGIIAIHIQHGERPIFFYGQHYMGTLEAYVAALLFQFLGASVFTLRLGLILLFVLFLLSMFLLTSELYNKKFALFTLLLLSLGSSAVLSRQLIALGGYVETLLFTVLLFLLVQWLALSTTKEDGERQPQGIVATRGMVADHQKRLDSGQPQGIVATRVWLGYACWGLVLGLALWSDELILPWAICSGALLLLFCWRELIKGTLFAVLGGLLLGAFPLILYNIEAPPGQDSWSVLIGQQGGVPLTLHTIIQQIRGTLAVSIPTITGNPFCHMDELANIKILGFAPSHPATLHCTLLGTTWSLLYLGLLLLSAAAPFRMLRKELLLHRQRPWTFEERTDIIRHALTCSLFAAALLTLLLYMHSHSPIDEPAEYSRYLLCLWITTPLVLWPLWSAATQRIKSSPPSLAFARLRLWLCRGLLLLLLVTLCYGTSETLSEILPAQTTTSQESQLIAGLTRHNITHIYTDYWTCDRLAFETQEHIICGVLAGGCTLQRGLHNRYEPYYTTVSRDPRTTYVILTSTHCDTAVARKMESKGQAYTRFTLNNYTVYQPS